jgi:SAM-dependent methyltransferase
VGWISRATGIRRWVSRATVQFDPPVDHTLRRLAPGARIADSSFDCIFCTGTLQHVTDPLRVLAEIHRLLRPGGIVHVELPFLQGYHPDPKDYWRWTLAGARLACERVGFEHLESGTHIGPTSALVWIAVHYVGGLLPGRLGSAVSHASRFVFRPLLVLDRLWRHNPEAQVIGCGVYFVGRKAEAPDPRMTRA